MGVKVRGMKEITTLSGLALAAVLSLAACGGGRSPGTYESGGNPSEEAVSGEQGSTVTLTLAAFGQNPQLTEQVAAFNRSHRDYQIAVEQYERSEAAEEDGIARLQREIMTGEGPDLIDFGSEYATGDTVGDYTEDLWPYLEAEGTEGGQIYFDNILSTFRNNGKLYALPVSFTMQTFAGSRTALGDRDHWNMRELAECYENRREGTILYPGEIKRDVFGTLMHGSLDYYIDWEKGDCSFDSEEFAQVLAFAGSFPDTLRISEEYSVKQIFYEGGALIYPCRMRSVYDICAAEYIFGAGDITYIGFPVEEGRGTVVSPGSLMLAVSVNSRHKEAAWEFIAGFLSEEYQSRISDGFPVLRSALERQLSENLEPEYGKDTEGNPAPVAKSSIRFEGEEPVEIYSITEAQAETLLHLIETASICSAGDRELYDILLEEADGYFSGDKGLEETVRVIQSRAKLYVSERVR